MGFYFAQASLSAFPFQTGWDFNPQ